MNQKQERKRTEEVQRLRKYNFNRSSEFQSLVDLSAELCDKPVAIIALLDKELNWIMVKKGVDVDVMPRETSFCQFTILQDDLMIVPDATMDKRFDNNPLVHDAPNIRFYAGMPLVIKGDLRVGTLCVFDVKPGGLTPLQSKSLVVLAKQVTFLMELEISYQLLDEQLLVIEGHAGSLRRIAHNCQGMSGPLTSMINVLDTVREQQYNAHKDHLLQLEEAVQYLDRNFKNVTALTRAYE